MKQYGKYRDSKVQWYGEVPEHWVISPLKSICTLNENSLTDKTPEDFEFEYIDISNVDSNGVILAPQKMRFKDSPSRARRIVREGDTIVSTVRTYLKAIAYISGNEKGKIVSTGFAVLTPKNVFDKRYFNYLVKSENLIEQITFSSKGVSYPAINSTDLSSLKVLHTTSKSEQESIADYLDSKVGRIDNLVRQKRLLLGKLQDKRQAIINEAVTKGVSLPTALKKSSTIFLDFIPNSWKEIKFKYLVRNGSLEIQDGNHGELHPTAEDYEDSGIPFIMANNVRTTGIDLLSCKFLPKEIADKLRIGFSKKGDVLLTHKGTIGRTAIVEDIPYDYLMLTPQVTYYRIKNETLHNRFILYFFQSSFFQEQIKLESSGGSTRSFIGITEQKELVFLMPSPLEQKEIANYLDQKLVKFTLLEKHISCQIEKLNTYRQSLISEVVTGKIKVV